jgi:2-methylisocitrate lyase-like PEP mutase family enzyme
MQETKAIAFQALHQKPGCFVIPNAWDAGSAILLESLGFQAIATTSAGLAFSLGVADGENAVSREQTLANAGAIAHATSLPVSADLEGGFGPAPEDCAKTIIAAAKAGVVGGSIEDSTGDDAEPIYELEHAVARVAAAVEAARSLAFPFTLTARAENFLHGKPDLKDTIKRLQAFQEAGADVLFAPGLGSADDIRAVVASVDRPLNVVMGLQSLKLSVSELADLGVKRVSVGGSLARAALAGLMKGAREVLSSGTFGYAAEALPHRELNSLFGRRP